MGVRAASGVDGGPFADLALGVYPDSGAGCHGGVALFCAFDASARRDRLPSDGAGLFRGGGVSQR